MRSARGDVMDGERDQDLPQLPALQRHCRLLQQSSPWISYSGSFGRRLARTTVQLIPSHHPALQGICSCLQQPGSTVQSGLACLMVQTCWSVPFSLHRMRRPWPVPAPPGWNNSCLWFEARTLKRWLVLAVSSGQSDPSMARIRPSLPSCRNARVQPFYGGVPLGILVRLPEADSFIFASTQHRQLLLQLGELVLPPGREGSV